MCLRVAEEGNLNRGRCIVVLCVCVSGGGGAEILRGKDRKMISDLYISFYCPPLKSFSSTFSNVGPFGAAIHYMPLQWGDEPDKSEDKQMAMDGAPSMY